MCGIAGLWSARLSASRLQDTAVAMASALIHRGPDDYGVWTEPHAGLSVSHRRLSIVDLSPAGHQPMASADDRLVLVFNGEIYNHMALRRELEQAGQASTWRGHSDTETLLAAFAAWGFEATLKKAVGMFALALWDKRHESLQLARDRVGEKPLYYGWVGGAFAFGSELKALRRVPGFDNPIDRDALALYMQFCAVPAPYSIYSDIMKLPPGTWMTVSRTDIEARRAQTPTAYWSAAETARRGVVPQVGSDAHAVSELERLLGLSIEGQMVADVPLGAFLSGGIDSSTVVALMQSRSTRPVRTFTIGFSEAAFDESADAASIARHLGTEHTEIRVTPADAKAVIQMLPNHYDEPFADSSQIPTLLVSKAARSHVTVALTGDGGDELFGGYDRYIWARRIWTRVDWIPFQLRKLIFGGVQKVPPQLLDSIAILTPSIRNVGEKIRKMGLRLERARTIDDLYRSLVTEWPAEDQVVPGAIRLPVQLDNRGNVAGIRDAEQRMMLFDTLGYMPDDILAKVDRAAMACSLETRVPFLDHNIVEFALRLPLNMKIRGKEGKWIVRQVLQKYVPRELTDRPKAGFSVPVGAWLRGPLRDWADGLLDERRLVREGYFDVALIRAKWNEHLTSRRDWTQSLWCVLMFEAWLDDQDR